MPPRCGTSGWHAPTPTNARCLQSLAKPPRARPCCQNWFAGLGGNRTQEACERAGCDPGGKPNARPCNLRCRQCQCLLGPAAASSPCRHLQTRRRNGVECGHRNPEHQTVPLHNCRAAKRRHCHQPPHRRGSPSSAGLSKKTHPRLRCTNTCSLGCRVPHATLQVLGSARGVPATEPSRKRHGNRTSDRRPALARSSLAKGLNCSLHLHWKKTSAATRTRRPHSAQRANPPWARPLAMPVVRQAE
mmetsp:Transcript_120623/g.300916  ORF Transcript_120623/g.300916 Transcript_120623/m.300916 type:complete len:245 (+) Transcript_120623:1641-2375(+)